MFPEGSQKTTSGSQGGCQDLEVESRLCECQYCSTAQVPNQGDIHVLQADLARQGFGVVRAFLSAELVGQCVGAVEAHVRGAVEGMGHQYVDLGSIKTPSGNEWCRAPAGWVGRPWGGCDKKGWIQTVGTGRLFEGFLPGAIIAAQWAAAPWVAGLLQVHTDHLVWKPERTSVKVAGCGPLPAHLDCERRGGVQVVVALSDLAFRVWPRSHTRRMGGKAEGFYPLSQEEQDGLPQPCRDIYVSAGTALFMRGGECVHGSPPVHDGEPPRVATYARFDLAV